MAVEPARFDQQRESDVLGFVKRTEFPVGADRWLTVVSPEQPDGTELSLVPDGHPAVKPFKEALARDGISGDIVRRGRLQAEFQRLQGFVVQFTQEPVVMGPATTAVFDDPCSNLIQIAQKN